MTIEIKVEDTELYDVLIPTVVKEGYQHFIGVCEGEVYRLKCRSESL